jgi:periplasmic mercuric ion binding protein
MGSSALWHQTITFKLFNKFKPITMKSLRIISAITICMAIAQLSFAQEKTETFKVSGNCGMCKSKIEKSAKAAGASFAAWDIDSKLLTVKYSSSSTNTAKIQKEIATVGYDNAGMKASSKAYYKLHGCCKYEREAAVSANSCTVDCKKLCEEKGCCKAGESCTQGCCTNESAVSKMDCCKKEAGKAMASCEKDCCKKKE